MSLDIYFVYDAEDKAQLEVKEIGLRDVLQFLQYFPRSSTMKEISHFVDSAFYPGFVHWFAPWEVQKLPNWEDIPEEEQLEIMEQGTEYIGDSFDPHELIAWANIWIKTLEEGSDAFRHAFLPPPNGHDRTGEVIDTLRYIAEQGRCAARHNLQMHIEMC